MTKSMPTKSLADSTMALLGQAMDRNTRLTSSVVTPMKAPASPALPAVPVAPLRTAAVPRMRPTPPIPHTIRTSGLRFTAMDHQRINGIINQALSLGQRIPMSDAIRLALIAYNPKSLTAADIAAVQATDGRMRRRTAGQ